MHAALGGSGKKVTGIRKAAYSWGFFSQGVAQLNLFDDNAPRETSAALIEILDALNNRHGRGSLFFAGHGIQPKWQIKRQRLSPRWTTRLSDVPQVS